MLGVEYQVHQENAGWSEWVKNGTIAGITGQSLRVEAIRFRLIDKPDGEEIILSGNAHAQDLGWMGFVNENEICGTVGESRRLEEIQFYMNGRDAEKYSIHYRTHSQDIGTQDWAVNGELSGSDGGGKRIEAIQIIVTDKGVDLGLYDIPSFKHFDPIPVPEPQPITTSRLNLRYFNEDTDFKCPCGCGLDVIDEIKIMTDNTRHEYGHPLFVSSAARCPEQNERDGGIPNSNHIKGQAVDLYAPGRMDSDEVDNLAEVMKNNGFGVIRYHDYLFDHGDLDGEDWSWN